MCPRSSDPFYVVTYYIKWVTSSWTYSTLFFISLVQVSFAAISSVPIVAGQLIRFRLLKKSWIEIRSPHFESKSLKNIVFIDVYDVSINISIIFYFIPNKKVKSNFYQIGSGLFFDELNPEMVFSRVEFGQTRAGSAILDCIDAVRGFIQTKASNYQFS